MLIHKLNGVACVVKLDVLVFIFFSFIFLLCFSLGSRYSTWFCGELSGVACVVKVDVPVLIFFFC